MTWHNWAIKREVIFSHDVLAVVDASLLKLPIHYTSSLSFQRVNRVIHWISHFVIYLDIHSAKRALWLVDLGHVLLIKFKCTRSGYNWAVVVRASHMISAWLNLNWRDLQHVLMSAWILKFASHSRGQETVNFNTGAFSGANVTVDFFIIPSEPLFLIEIIKTLHSNYSIRPCRIWSDKITS